MDGLMDRCVCGCVDEFTEGEWMVMWMDGLTDVCACEGRDVRGVCTYVVVVASTLNRVSFRSSRRCLSNRSMRHTSCIIKYMHVNCRSRRQTSCIHKKNICSS